MDSVTAWAGRLEILPFLPAFGYSTKLCQPARLLRGHAGHQAGGRHALRQAARHEDRFMELITEENGV